MSLLQVIPSKQHTLEYVKEQVDISYNPNAPGEVGRHNQDFQTTARKMILVYEATAADSPHASRQLMLALTHLEQCKDAFIKSIMIAHPQPKPAEKKQE